MRNGFLKGPPSPFFFSRGDVKREKRRRGRRKGKKNPPPGGFPQVTQQRKKRGRKRWEKDAVSRPPSSFALRFGLSANKGALFFWESGSEEPRQTLISGEMSLLLPLSSSSSSSLVLFTLSLSPPPPPGVHFIHSKEVGREGGGRFSPKKVEHVRKVKMLCSTNVVQYDRCRVVGIQKRHHHHGPRQEAQSTARGGGGGGSHGRATIKLLCRNIAEINSQKKST